MNIPTVGDRLQAVRTSVVTALGLMHAAKEIGDQDIPGSFYIDSQELVDRAHAVLGQATVELYYLVATTDVGGDGEFLNAPAPGKIPDEELARLQGGAR